MENVTLSVNPEWKTIVDSLGKAYGDRSSGAAVLGTDLLPLVMTALSAYSLLGADVKSPDNLAYLMKVIGVQIFPVAKAA